jgi:HEAT repeat protein
MVSGLSDRDSEVRRSAAVGLGEVRHKGGLTMLEQLVDNDSNADVRAAAAAAIERIRTGK